MERKELEIMAPAGNFECLRAAIQGVRTLYISVLDILICAAILPITSSRKTFLRLSAFAVKRG